jgi:hypothetical protein
MKPLITIGRAEQIQLVDFDDQNITAKVDTGADISSIWASRITEEDGSLSFVLFGKKSPYYSGKVVRLSKPHYRLTRIANSFGAKEMRYVVKMRVRIHGRVINVVFSLANRSKKTYPILLGRRLLNKKFLVDVSQGQPLVQAEKARRRKMHIELGQEEG